jgi:phage baseplate assembly protein V
MTHFKFGIISNLDIPNGLAKVYFEEDDFESGWLKMSVMRSGKDQVSFPYDIKEHVWCVLDEHCEYGVIGGAVYDDNNKPEGSAAGKLKLLFGDNSTIEYDRSSSILKFDIQGEVHISGTKIIANANEVDVTAQSVKISAPVTEIDGALTVSGVVSMGGISGVSGADISGSGAKLNVNKVTASDDVTAGGISLKTHKHTSAASGSPTSTPLP